MHDARFDWSRLNHLQVGRFAEYFVKMEFTLYGFDIYTSEVDDRGIDFVIRKHCDRYYDIQVKSARGFNYIFFQKAKFELRPNLFSAIVILQPLYSPELYLIPSEAWQSPNGLLVSRDYEGNKEQTRVGPPTQPKEPAPNGSLQI
jgi:hypothetical protein